MTRMRVGVLLVLFATLSAANGEAQTRPLRASAYSRALDVTAIAKACDSGAACSASFVQRVLAFRQAPFDPNVVVPDRAVVDSALDEVSRGRQQALSGASDESMRLAGGSFVGISSVAWAVTDFIGDRAKAELVQSAFRDLAVKLKAEPLDSLLPKTNAVLVAVDEMQYRIVLPTLRAAFREDLRAMPARLDRISEKVLKDKGTRDFLAIVSRLNGAYRRIDAGEDPLQVIAEWGAGASAALSRAERLAASIAHEGRAIEAAAGAADLGARVDALLKDDTLRRMFAAMVVDGIWERAEVGKKQQVILDQLAAGLGAILDMRAAALTLSGTGATDAERLGARSRVANAVSTLVHVSVVPGTETQGSIEAALATGVELWTAIDARDYPRIVVLSVGAIRSLGKADTSAVPMRLLAFAAAVAAATDEDDVEAALEALADPVGSFRGRRVKGAWSVAVVSYVGGSYGRERIVGDVRERGANYGGVSAPVGIEWSRGTRLWLVRSIGVNFSPLDFGTLLSYRTDPKAVADPGTGDETVSADPEVSLDHILAPSAQLTLGLTSNYPITLGIGWQRAARLRTLEGGDKVSARRFYVMLGVDLTLLRFR